MIEQTKGAVERSMEMITIPLKDLPLLAVEFAHKLCSQVGGCLEVFITAYAVYAQCVEGLECSDDLYLAREDHALWFAERGYSNAQLISKKHN